MPMAIITLEDLEGQIDGTIFAESVEEIVKQPEMVGDRMRSTCAAGLCVR